MGDDKNIKISWGMLYQVALLGTRNFGIKNARAVAELTGTDPIIWIDKEKFHLRKRHFESIEGNFGAVRRKQHPHKRGGKNK